MGLSTAAPSSDVSAIRSFRRYAMLPSACILAAVRIDLQMYGLVNSYHAPANDPRPRERERHTARQPAVNGTVVPETFSLPSVVTTSMSSTQAQPKLSWAMIGST